MIDIKLIQMEFTENVGIYLTFSSLCNTCGIVGFTSKMKITKLVNLVVQCSGCREYPSVASLHPLLLKTLKEDWGYLPEDVKKIEEKILLCVKDV